MLLEVPPEILFGMCPSPQVSVALYSANNDRGRDCLTALAPFSPLSGGRRTVWQQNFSILTRQIPRNHLKQ